MPAERSRCEDSGRKLEPPHTHTHTHTDCWSMQKFMHCIMPRRIPSDLIVKHGHFGHGFQRYHWHEVLQPTTVCSRDETLFRKTSAVSSKDTMRLLSELPLVSVAKSETSPLPITWFSNMDSLLFKAATSDSAAATRVFKSPVLALWPLPFFSARVSSS